MIWATNVDLKGHATRAFKTNSVKHLRTADGVQALGKLLPSLVCTGQSMDIALVHFTVICEMQRGR